MELPTPGVAFNFADYRYRVKPSNQENVANMSEHAKNEFLLANFAINCELKKIKEALTVITDRQERVAHLLNPKPKEERTL